VYKFQLAEVNHMSHPLPTQVQAQDLIRGAEKALAEAFEKVEAISLINQRRVLEAFGRHRLTEEHFAETTGYGLDDAGRAVIDEIFADVMQAEKAAVRLQFVSGTHAIACALLGNLSKGDRMVSLTGTPYDTLHPVIGLEGQSKGSLIAAGVEYKELDIDANLLHEQSTKEKLANVLANPTTVAYIQKSCGYSFNRRTISNNEIAKLCQAVKEINSSVNIIVDNCYGEFVEEMEPTACGADMVAGSLIKNPGGGLAITGGYLAGKKELVQAALERLTAPGIGGKQGVTYNQGRLLLQGLFMAPSVVAGAVKGALLIARVFEELELNVKPSSAETRFDIIQAVELKTKERLINFCRSVQMASPINAHVIPEPALLPGYVDEVVMAGGTFVQGSTMELSADGPLRPPYVAYVQGGLTYLHVKCMVENLLKQDGWSSR
jgi:cystathionine beta-lyase family protein involved in aluminum resistance